MYLFSLNIYMYWMASHIVDCLFLIILIMPSLNSWMVALEVSSLNFGKN